MRCEDFRVMLDNYANLSDEEKARLNEHAEHCPECKAELDFLLSVIDTMNTLPNIEPPSDFLDKLNKRIDAEERKNKGIWTTLKRNCRTYSGLAACLLLAAVIAPNGQTLGDKMMYPDDGALVSYSVTTDINNKTNRYGTADDVSPDKAAPTLQPAFGPRATSAPQTGLFGSQRSDVSPSSSFGAASSFGMPSFGASSSGTTQKNTSSAIGNQLDSSNSKRREASPAQSKDNTADRTSFGSTAFGSPSFSSLPSHTRPSGVNIPEGTHITTAQNNPGTGASEPSKSSPVPTAPKTSADAEELTAAPQPYAQIDGGTESENTTIDKNGQDESCNTAAGPMRIERSDNNTEEEDYSSAPAENRQRESSSGKVSGGSSSSSSGGGGGASGGNTPSQPTSKPNKPDDSYTGDEPSATAAPAAPESTPTPPKPTRRPTGPAGAGSPSGSATSEPQNPGEQTDSNIPDVSPEGPPAPGAPDPPVGDSLGSACLTINYNDPSQYEAARDILSSYASKVNGGLYIIDINSLGDAVNEISDIVPYIDLDIFSEGYMFEVTVVFNLIESNPDDEDTDRDTDKQENGGDDIDLSSDETASKDGGTEDTSTGDTDNGGTDTNDSNTEDTDNENADAEESGGDASN